MTCHNSYPDFVLGSTNKFNKVPTGIDCERCHGPGDLHVKNIELGNVVDTSIYFDYSIVNPSSLSIELQNEICSRCHIQGNSVLKYDKSFFDFKPGMYLNEVMDVYFPRYKNADDEFIMASHVDRLKQSKCFINSNNQISCIDCHDPHISVKKTDHSVFNSACFSCHNIDNCQDFPNKNHLNNDCVSCHMKESGTIDIPHVTITDHKISIPKINNIEEKKVFLGLHCVNNDNPSYYSITNAYLQEYDKFSKNPAYLDSASIYLQKMDLSSKEGLFSHLYYLFLNQDMMQICSIVDEIGKKSILNMFKDEQFNNFDAWTCYRIGEAFYSKKKYNSSIIFFEQASSLAPFNLNFLDKYGSNLIMTNNFDEAKSKFQSIIIENNQFVSAYNNLSRLYFEEYLQSKYEGDKNLSNYYCDIALTIDPIYKEAMLNKIDLFLVDKDFQQAKLLLIKILDLYPETKDADLLLNKLNEEYF
jgi:tetratricopeptide (TPR) repeat protein